MIVTTPRTSSTPSSAYSGPVMATLTPVRNGNVLANGSSPCPSTVLAHTPGLFSEGIDETPSQPTNKGRYPHYCPICMLHFRRIYTTLCCTNNICEGCGTAMMHKALKASPLFKAITGMAPFPQPPAGSHEQGQQQSSTSVNGDKILGLLTIASLIPNSLVNSFSDASLSNTSDNSSNITYGKAINDTEPSRVLHALSPAMKQRIRSNSPQKPALTADQQAQLLVSVECPFCSRCLKVFPTRRDQHESKSYKDECRSASRGGKNSNEEADEYYYEEVEEEIYETDTETDADEEGDRKNSLSTSSERLFSATAGPREEQVTATKNAASELNSPKIQVHVDSNTDNNNNNNKNNSSRNVKAISGAQNAFGPHCTRMVNGVTSPAVSSNLLFASPASQLAVGDEESFFLSNSLSLRGPLPRDPGIVSPLNLKGTENENARSPSPQLSQLVKPSQDQPTREDGQDFTNFSPSRRPSSLRRLAAFAKAAQPPPHESISATSPFMAPPIPLPPTKPQPFGRRVGNESLSPTARRPPVPQSLSPAGLSSAGTDEGEAGSSSPLSPRQVTRSSGDNTKLLSSESINYSDRNRGTTPSTLSQCRLLESSVKSPAVFREMVERERNSRARLDLEDDIVPTLDISLSTCANEASEQGVERDNPFSRQTVGDKYSVLEPTSVGKKKRLQKVIRMVKKKRKVFPCEQHNTESLALRTEFQPGRSPARSEVAPLQAVSPVKPGDDFDTMRRKMMAQTSFKSIFGKKVEEVSKTHALEMKIRKAMEEQSQGQELKKTTNSVYSSVPIRFGYTTSTPSPPRATSSSQAVGGLLIRPSLLNVVHTRNNAITAAVHSPPSSRFAPAPPPVPAPSTRRSVERLLSGGDTKGGGVVGRGMSMPSTSATTSLRSAYSTSNSTQLARTHLPFEPVINANTAAERRATTLPATNPTCVLSRQDSVVTPDYSSSAKENDAANFPQIVGHDNLTTLSNRNQCGNPLSSRNNVGNVKQTVKAEPRGLALPPVTATRHLTPDERRRSHSEPLTRNRNKSGSWCPVM